MNINAMTSPATAGAGAQAASKANGTLGKDDFLKLLVTQLQNQDPLNPTDNTQFVAQLAQFSSLEGITNLNKSMDDISSGMSSLTNSNSASLIGKVVKAEGSDFVFTGSPVQAGYDLTGSASSVRVSISDFAGRVVKTLDLGPQSAGIHNISWDGTDNAGMQVAQGSYGFTIGAKDPAGDPVSANTYIFGEVSGVSFDSGNANLVVNGKELGQNKLKGIYR